MFITNSQLFNKITVLENKINRLNISNNCCDCNLYEQLKDYLDTKLSDIYTKIIQTDNLKLFEKYQNEITKTIKTLKDEMENKSKNEMKNEMKNEIKNISLQIELMTEKMGSLYFENEIFKHQLSLEDDIRKSMDEIDTITNIINNSVYEIDILLNTIYIKKIE